MPMIKLMVMSSFLRRKFYWKWLGSIILMFKSVIWSKKKLNLFDFGRIAAQDRQASYYPQKSEKQSARKLLMPIRVAWRAY